MSSRLDFEVGLAFRSVAGTVELMEEAIAGADGPEVASLMRLLKIELAGLKELLEERA